MSINQLMSTNSLPKPLQPPSNSPTPPAANVTLRAAPDPAPETAPAVESESQVRQAVEQIQQTAEKLAQNLQFSIDKDTGITVIKVLDSQTQEVIRQIPTEEAVSIARTLDKVQGLLFNDQA